MIGFLPKEVKVSWENTRRSLRQHKATDLPWERRGHCNDRPAKRATPEKQSGGMRCVARQILLQSLRICLRLNPLVIRSTIAAGKGRQTMKNPLDSMWGTIISGLILTLVFYVFARAFLPF
jgi:hypothetical protein